ncbi:MAG: cytochrome c oxidase assembly protein [Mycetocola sp.]
MTGNPTPPEPSLLTFFTEWRVDPLWTMVCAAGLVFYLLGVRRLRARGGLWPHTRTLAWVAGLSVVFYATSGSVAVYQDYLLGFNVASLALMCFVAPVALLAARPATLALLVIEPRPDQSIGGAELAGWIIRATAVRGVRSPIMWATIMLVSIPAFYFTPWVVSSVRDPFGFHVTVAWFGLVGVMLVRSLLSSHAVAPAIVALGVVLLGLIGVALALQIYLASSGAEWFRDLQLGWRDDPRAGSYLLVAFAAVWSSVLAAAVLYRYRQITPVPEVPREILINGGTN